MERGRIEGLPKFFEYPLLSQERIKLQTSNFVCTFLLVSIGTKALYKFREKEPGAFARTLETFQGTHILGASRGRLCDSKAFLSCDIMPSDMWLIGRGRLRSLLHRCFLLFINGRVRPSNYSN